MGSQKGTLRLQCPRWKYDYPKKDHVFVITYRDEISPTFKGRSQKDSQGCYLAPLPFLKLQRGYLEVYVQWFEHPVV